MNFQSNDFKGVRERVREQENPAYTQTHESGKTHKPSGESASRIEKSVYQPVDSMENLAGYTEYKLPGREIADTQAQRPILPEPLKDVQEETPVYKPYSEDEQKQIDQFFNQMIENELSVISQSADFEGAPEKISELKQAFETGKVPSSIAASYVAISQTATDKVRESFAIPNWSKGVTNPADLTPVGLNATQSIQIGNQQTTQFLNGLTNHLQGIQKGIEKLASESPEGLKGKFPGKQDDPISYGDYLQAISEAISYLQEQLNRMQSQDAMTTMNTSQVKQGDIEAQQTQAQDQQEQMLKQINRSGIMKIVSDTMKILGPVIMGAAIIGTALSGGALAPLLISAAVMLTFTVLNNQFDIVQKAVQGVDDIVNSVLPKDAPDWVKDVVKVAVMATTVIAIVVAGAAITGGASLLSNEGVKAAVVGVTKILGTQAVMMTVMCSNAIPELAGDVVKACGGSQSASEITQVVAMIAQAAVIMGAMFICGPKAPGSGTKAAAASVEKTAFNLEKGLNYLKNAAKATKEALTPSFPTIQDIINGMKQLSEGTEKQVAGKIMTFVAEIAGPATNAVAGGVNATCLFLSANAMSEIGNSKAEVEYLKTLIDFLEKLLDSLQSSMTNRADEQASIQTLYTQVLQMYNSATRPVIISG